MKPFDENSTQPWHTLSVEDVISRLESNLHGLADSEATHRLSKYGLNELKAAAPVSRWAILAAQFKNVLIIILLMGAALSAFLGHGTEAVAISVMVLLAVLLGFVQEYRAERALEALSRMAAPTAAVLRDGQEIVIPASKLVPGDCVLLRTGDRVPADLRLLETVNLQCDEAALTGESVPVEKQTARLEDPNLSVGDRSNTGLCRNDDHLRPGPRHGGRYRHGNRIRQSGSDVTVGGGRPDAVAGEPR